MTIKLLVKHRMQTSKARTSHALSKDHVDMPATITTAASAEEDATSRTKRQPRQHTVPEPGSLWDVMHDHQGTSLFVLPLCWTDMHTQLLGCRFVKQPPQLTPVPPTHSSPRRSPQTSETLVEIGRELDILMARDTPRNVMSKSRALKSIMSTFYPNHLAKPKSNAELGIRFGSRLYQKSARAQIAWKHHDASMSFDSATTWTSSRNTSQLLASMNVKVANDAYVLAYTSRSNLNFTRHNCFRIIQGPNRNPNLPVLSLQKLRSKNLVPSNLDEDPYFVATIISLAQQQFYLDGGRFNDQVSREFTVRLFTTSEEDESFIVYTAKISADFMMKFHYPHLNRESDATYLNIEYKHVPVWPILGLKERLGQALGEDLVGFIDPLNIETFPDEQDEQEEIVQEPKVTSPKRRRDIFTEVLNASFNEEREPSSSDEISGMGKRRCLEEGRVGVVR
ncbi:hypothetical protein BJ166DRAFT_87802 [Pestalotiopsis sp. NC0098]|nr:hypothetical protein BJ166DRAFT_87802 [Pestalotiopsis sp. NC0098]